MNIKTAVMQEEEKKSAVQVRQGCCEVEAAAVEGVLTNAQCNEPKMVRMNPLPVVLYDKMRCC